VADTSTPPHAATAWRLFIISSTQVTTFATTQGGGGRSIYGPGRRVGAEISYNF
jgi:hypothetical protein